MLTPRHPVTSGFLSRSSHRTVFPSLMCAGQTNIGAGICPVPGLSLWMSFRRLGELDPLKPTMSIARQGFGAGRCLYSCKGGVCRGIRHGSEGSVPGAEALRWFAGSWNALVRTRCFRPGDSRPCLVDGRRNKAVFSGNRRHRTQMKLL